MRLCLEKTFIVRLSYNRHLMYILFFFFSSQFISPPKRPHSTSPVKCRGANLFPFKKRINLHQGSEVLKTQLCFKKWLFLLVPKIVERKMWFFWCLYQLSNREAACMGSEEMSCAWYDPDLLKHSDTCPMNFQECKEMTKSSIALSGLVYLLW